MAFLYLIHELCCNFPLIMSLSSIENKESTSCILKPASCLTPHTWNILVDNLWAYFRGIFSSLTSMQFNHASKGPKNAKAIAALRNAKISYSYEVFPWERKMRDLLPVPGATGFLSLLPLPLSLATDESHQLPLPGGYTGQGWCLAHVLAEVRCPHRVNECANRGTAYQGIILIQHGLKFI